MDYSPGTPSQHGPDSTEPRYTVKVAAQLAGISPVTLRAWERRYGLPSPARESQGYRLYSDADLRVLRWLKAEVDEGIAIGRAAQRLQELRAAGRDPLSSPMKTFDRPASVDNLSAQLVSDLKGLDESAARSTLDAAFALYPVDRVLFEVIAPALVAIGEAWHAGEIPIATEHFATQLCQSRIHALFSVVPRPVKDGVIIAAASPGEQHHIGLLMVTTLLRFRGWDVRYFGQDLSLDRLAEILDGLDVRLILFSCTSRESIRHLQRSLLRTPLTATWKIAVGGQAIQQDPGLAPPGTEVLTETGPAAVESIEAMVRTPIPFSGERRAQ